MPTTIPDLRIVYTYAPPFRPLTEDEDTAIVEAISASGAAVVFVGARLSETGAVDGFPQGTCKRDHGGRGFAFDFLSGGKPAAPSWMQGIGLEWLFRLITEPRRLWWRYAYHNPRFVALIVRQYLTSASK